MKALAVTLLRDREAFWDGLATQSLQWKQVLGLAAFVVLGSGIYGAVLAGWRAPLLSVYVAIKLPMLFLGTIVIVSLFNWMVASILGSGLSFRSTVFVVLVAMTIGCWILLSLVPVALFFLATGISYTGTHAELQYAHNAILMIHIFILALAGIVGNAALLRDFGALWLHAVQCSPCSCTGLPPLLS